MLWCVRTLVRLDGMIYGSPFSYYRRFVVKAGSREDAEAIVGEVIKNKHELNVFRSEYTEIVDDVAIIPDALIGGDKVWELV